MKLFSKILYLAIHGIEQQAALARAVTLAQNNQARLTVLAILPPMTAGIGMPPGGPITAQLRQTLASEAQQWLEALVAPSQKQLEISIELSEGKLFLEAIRAVLRHGYDLVIKPTENPATLSHLFGSDDMHLLRKCPCPVWLLKPDEKPNYSNIITALDFDPWRPETLEQPLNLQLLELGASLALSDFATLHLVHAWETAAEEIVRHWGSHPVTDTIDYLEGERTRQRAGLEKLAQRLHQQIGDEAWDYLSPRQHLPHGPARLVIPAQARELKADLVVMGTVGRGGVPGLLIGNTAEAILDQLHCSVLALKPPGFITPVTEA
jgi:nucleotide-binding universal stress UspA family protein